MEKMTVHDKNMHCKVCKSPSRYYLSTKVLGKYDVIYYKCQSCFHIQTEEPYWLNEAYSSAITKLDIGLIARNEFIVPIVKTVIVKWFDYNSKFVDYGGGYGMLVRMMRDRGFDFYRQDVYCENLYAEYFDVQDYAPFKAELLTAFEVFEHLNNPVEEVKRMLDISDNILFTTSIQPSHNVTPESWWYFIPETGQHISLYSRSSLNKLASHFGLNYYWSGTNLHLFTRKKISSSLFKVFTNYRFAREYSKLIGPKKTFLDTDFSVVRNKLNKSLLFR